jgi:hypothetical protein
MLRGGVRRGEVEVPSCTVHSTTIEDGVELRALATMNKDTLLVPPPAQEPSLDGRSDGGEQGEEAELRG